MTRGADAKPSLADISELINHAICHVTERGLPSIEANLSEPACCQTGPAVVPGNWIAENGHQECSRTSGIVLCMSYCEIKEGMDRSADHRGQSPPEDVLKMQISL